MNQTKPLDQHERKLKTIFGNRKPKIALALTLGLIVSCSAVAFVSRAHAVLSQPEVGVMGQPPPALQPVRTVQSGEKPGVEVIAISADGFEPTAITRGKGLICIVVANENSYEETALVLDQVAGSRLAQTDIPPSQPRWNGWFDLVPGEYLLSDQLHPERSCHITITSQ